MKVLDQLVKDLEESGCDRHLRYLNGYGYRAKTGVSHLGSEPFYKEDTVGCPKLKEVRSF